MSTLLTSLKAFLSRYPRPRWILAGTIPLLLIFILTSIYWDYTQDDVFITYTYSRNITEGQGFVFNPGQRVQGTTTPLYTLVMAGVYLLNHDVLHAGNLISAALLATTGLMAVILVAPSASNPTRLAIALTIVVCPLVYVSFGMETLLYCAILLMALWLWRRQQRTAAMLVAAALTWTRADGVVLAGSFLICAAWDSWKGSQTIQNWIRSLPWGLTTAYLAGIAPWFVFAWLYFGSPLPNTFSAKQEIFQGIKFWSDGLGWWQAFYGNNWLSLLALPLIGLGGWRAWRDVRLAPLPLWAVLFMIGYSILNVTAFWYYTPLVVGMIMLAGLGGEWLAQFLISRTVSRTAVIVGSTGLILVSTGLAFLNAWNYGSAPPRVRTYILVGQWIERNTDQKSTLLIGDLGIMGFHARRQTIDSPGLITPTMYYRLDTYAAAKFKPDYIVATQYYTWVDLAQQEWFQYHYAPVAQLSTPADGFSPITVFERRWPLETPTQIVQGYDLPLNCIVTLPGGEILPTQTTARLIASNGAVVVEATHPFLWGQYPDVEAVADEILYEQIALPLDIPPGRYLWALDCDQPLRGEVDVLPIESAAGYVPLDEGTQWRDLAALRGFVVPDQATVWSGGTLEISLHWSVLSAPTEDYSVFVHLLDAAGTLVAQSDGYPRNGDRPTSSWAAGDTIVDSRRIALPPDLPAGDYQLVIGWYDWQTGQRIMLADGSDSLLLPIIVRNQWPGGSGLP